MFTGKSSTPQLMFIKDGNTINRLSTNKGKVIKGVDDNGNKVDDVSIVDVNRISMAKSKDLVKIEAGFLTFKARLAFVKLRSAFIKVLILHYFDLKYHIRIKTNVLGYAIGEVLSQLTLDEIS